MARIDLVRERNRMIEKNQEYSSLCSSNRTLPESFYQSRSPSITLPMLLWTRLWQSSIRRATVGKNSVMMTSREAIIGILLPWKWQSMTVILQWLWILPSCLSLFSVWKCFREKVTGKFSRNFAADSLVQNQVEEILQKNSSKEFFKRIPFTYKMFDLQTASVWLLIGFLIITRLQSLKSNFSAWWGSPDLRVSNAKLIRCISSIWLGRCRLQSTYTLQSAYSQIVVCLKLAYS